MGLFDRLRRRRSSPDGPHADPTGRVLFAASLPPQNVDERPLTVTDRAQVAREFTVTDRLPRAERPPTSDDQLFTTPRDRPDDRRTDHRASPETRRLPAVRVDDEAIEHPAPPRAFSPAEALHLAGGTMRDTRRLTTSPRPTDAAHAPDAADATVTPDAADTTDAPDATDPSGAGGERPQ